MKLSLLTLSATLGLTSAIKTKIGTRKQHTNNKDVITHKSSLSATSTIGQKVLSRARKLEENNANGEIDYTADFYFPAGIFPRLKRRVSFGNFRTAGKYTLRHVSEMAMCVRIRATLCSYVGGFLPGFVLQVAYNRSSSIPMFEGGRWWL